MNATTDWQPTGTQALLAQRSQMYALIREFFNASGALEVETPLLASASVTDAYIASFVVSDKHNPAFATALYLQTSPEYAMKRLLASGSGDIFQICKAFRCESGGRYHNPEFSILEWYRVGRSLEQLMAELFDLMQTVFAHFSNRSSLSTAEYLSYQELFIRYLSLDPFVATIEELRTCAYDHACATPALQLPERDDWLSLLLTHVIEPELQTIPALFVYDYPASQAALARLKDSDVRMAQRFELYIYGLEIANGFDELTDPLEQRARFIADNQQRKAFGLHPVPLDEYFLAALSAGLPPCVGVAVGLDRVLMQATGADDIAQTLTFPITRS
jgi:lysyl-tRNA synthetase class 2